MRTERGGDSGGAFSSAPPSIPDHQMIRRIGSGSYGDVWLARNVLGTYRAVKVVYRSRFEDERPYEREFSGIKKFEPISRCHEGLVDVLQIGRNDSAHYFYYVMELADAVDDNPQTTATGSVSSRSSTAFNSASYCPRTLATDLQRHGRLPVSECIQRGLALSIALEYLHEQGLVHRDIKPSNVIFVNGTPKLADIGLVAEASTGGSLVGTVGFMPPEGPGTAQADIYSLGKVVYELSTGKDRENWPNPLTNLGAISDRNEWLELNAVVARACEPDIRRRYASASELRGDLALLLGGKSVRRLRSLERARKRVIAIAAVSVLLGLAWAAAKSRIAAEQTFGREIREAQIARLGVRIAGWSRVHAAHVDRARKVRSDEDVRDETATAFAGLDVHPIAGVAKIGGSCVAFGTNGNVLYGGLTNHPAHILLPGATNFSELGESADGPVAFDSHDRPVQFAFATNGLFVIRDLATHRVFREFSLGGEPTTGYDGRPALAISPKASLVAAAVQLSSGGGQFAVWDVTSGNQLVCSNELATAIAFSPDAQYFAAGFEDGHITVHSLPDFRKIVRLGARRAAISGLTFGRDPTVSDTPPTNNCPWLLASGDAAAGVVVYQLATGNVISKPRGSASDVHTLAFGSDSTILAGAGREDVRIWDVATESLLLRINGESGGPPLDYARMVEFSPDDKRLAVATEALFYPASVSVWDVEEDRGVKTLRGLDSIVQRVWWSPDSRQLAALSDNWDLAIWSSSDAKLTHLVRIPIGASSDNAAAAFFPRKNQIAFAAGKHVRLYDLLARTLLHEWQVPAGYCESLRIDDSGRILFLHCEDNPDASRYRSWALYDLSLSNGVVPLFKQKEADWRTWGTALPTHGDGFLVWGGPRDRTPRSQVQIFSLTNGKLIRQLLSPSPYNSVNLTLNPAGNLIAFSTSNGASMYSIPDGTLATNLPRLPTAIAPLADKFAYVEGDGGWHISDRANKKYFARLGKDVNGSLRPEFSPDGTLLAMPTVDGRVLVANLSQIDSLLGRIRK